MDVTGFGSLNYDRLYRVNELAQRGNEANIIEFREEFGGSAANTIISLSRLGFRTSFFGVVGKDNEGTSIMNNLRAEKVSTELVSVKHGKTSSILIFIDSRGERTMYVSPGVSKTLSIGDLTIDKIKSSKYLHLSSFIGEKQFGLQKTVINQLDKVRISFAPGASYVKKGLSALENFLKKTHVLFLNEDELFSLTSEEYKLGAEKMLSMGAKIVAVTLGNEGCYVTDGTTIEQVPAYQVKAVDTTGAGDAFSAGFLAGLISGKPLRVCGQMGNKVASLCVQKIGAREGLPTKGKLGAL